MLIFSLIVLLFGLVRETAGQNVPEPDIISILAELEALHTENVNAELGNLQILEKVLFDFFVQSGCGNGRDLDLIKTINKIDEDQTAFNSFNQLRWRVLRLNGFTPAQEFVHQNHIIFQNFLLKKFGQKLWLTNYFLTFLRN